MLTIYKMSEEAGPSEQEVTNDSGPASSEEPPITNESVKDEWDPMKATAAIVTPRCLVRVKRDMISMYNDPPPGIFAVPDSENLTTIHALIIGTLETPYEGGLFYFLINCPPEYPIKPPRARFMTTDGGRVRFNPNLYKNGKICLSILGTWDGPEWSPAQSLSSVLISIQSILNEKPYHNEPAHDRERKPGDAARYNEVIQHETLRVAVCGMVENETRLKIPVGLTQIMEKTFLVHFESYLATAKKNLYLDGQPMRDPFCDARGQYQYGNIIKRLEALYPKISEKCARSQETVDAVAATNE